MNVRKTLYCANLASPDGSLQPAYVKLPLETKQKYSVENDVALNLGVINISTYLRDCSE